MLRITNYDILFRNETVEKAPKWNAIDGKTDRSSLMGDYKLINGLPRYMHVTSRYIMLNLYGLNIKNML